MKYLNTYLILHVLIFIMHSALNLFVCPNSIFHTVFCLFYWKGYVLSGEIALKNNHYYYYYFFMLMTVHHCFRKLRSCKTLMINTNDKENKHKNWCKFPPKN